MIKGIAILVMIYHHFFGGYAVPIDISEVGQNDPLFYYFNLFARSGKICISLFAFITGYGFYYIISKEKKSIIPATFARLKKVYLFFLFISILIFVSVNIWPCNIKFNLNRWPHQLYGSLPDHWYMSVVLVSVLIYFPLLLWSYRKGKHTHNIAFFTLILLNIITLTIPELKAHLKICHLGEVLKVMPFFMLGYSLHYIRNSELKRAERWLIFALTIIFCTVFGYSKKWAFVLLFCTFVVNYKYVKETAIGSILAYLGTYSMCMWLNHRLIFGYWFVDSIYTIPTPLNYVFIVALSLVLSVILTHGYDKGCAWLRTKLVACLSQLRLRKLQQ